MTTSITKMDVQQWDSFYRQHASWLLGLLHYQTGNHHLAEDISHDTFVKVMVSVTARALNIQQSPRALLKIISKQLFIDKIRRDAIEKHYWDYLAVVQETVQSVDLEMHMSAIETLSNVSKTLSQRSQREQSIFALYYFNGCKQADIATQLSISIATVKRDLSQCLMHCYHFCYDWADC
jgi:RNA polymerase sigma-70 factor (ECF subfamily)